MTTVINKTNTSVINSSVTLKSGKKVKKSDFNILKFLLDNHTKELVTTISIPSSGAKWNQIVRTNKVANNSGLLILVSSSNVVLYIGQTNYIGDFVNSLANLLPNLKPAKVYIVGHDNASKHIYAVTAYRSKFRPIYNNNNINNRFMFSNTITTLNVTDTNVRSVEWIKNNPNATYTQFINQFNIGEMRRLCRLYSVGKYSYAALKTTLGIK
jgi:hypothetical protein